MRFSRLISLFSSTSSFLLPKELDSSSYQLSNFPVCISYSYLSLPSFVIPPTFLLLKLFTLSLRNLVMLPCPFWNWEDLQNTLFSSSPTPSPSPLHWLTPCLPLSRRDTNWPSLKHFLIFRQVSNIVTHLSSLNLPFLFHSIGHLPLLHSSLISSEL